jgi:hypothetical protein
MAGGGRLLGVLIDARWVLVLNVVNGIQRVQWRLGERRSTGMITQKAYVNTRQEASVVCPNCAKQVNVCAAPYENCRLDVKARCGCGSEFIVAFEWRRSYRKKVNFGGQYFSKCSRKEFGEMVVEDISRSGMRFRTHFGHGMDVNTVVQAKFTLDDSVSSKITKNMIVRHVADGYVGAEFCDSGCEKALGFYLMA